MDLREQFWPLLGNWAGMEEQAASRWAPPATTRAMLTFKLDVADRVVVQDYRQVRADGSEFTGHGVFLLDPESEQVLWWLFDSYAQVPVPAAGGWDRGELVLTKTTPRGRAEHRFLVVGDELRYRIQLQLADAAELAPFLSGTYHRISGH